jgi:hypothetical protein
MYEKQPYLSSALLHSTITLQRLVEENLTKEAGVFRNKLQADRQRLITVGLDPDVVLKEQFDLLRRAIDSTAPASPTSPETNLP